MGRRTLRLEIAGYYLYFHFYDIALQWEMETHDLEVTGAGCANRSSKRHKEGLPGEEPQKDFVWDRAPFGRLKSYE